MNILEINNVSQVFGGLMALDSVSFTVKKDEIFGLIGPNGAGKTTLFNVITGIYHPLSGDVIFSGHSLKRYRPYQVAKAGIGRTFQNIRLFKKLSVLDNIRVGMHAVTRAGMLGGTIRAPWAVREEREIVDKSLYYLELVGLKSRAMELAQSLPYGEQRRLEIARALAVNPKLLLLDEPAAGMNATEKDELLTLIRKISSMGITILLVEHDMRVVMNVCQRIAVLDYGRKIAEGTPGEISNDERVIQSYLGAQV